MFKFTFPIFFPGIIEVSPSYAPPHPPSSSSGNTACLFLLSHSQQRYRKESGPRWVFHLFFGPCQELWKAGTSLCPCTRAVSRFTPWAMGKISLSLALHFGGGVGQEGALKIPELLSLRSWVLLGLGQAGVGSIPKRDFWIFCRASDLPSGRVCHLPRHCRPASGSFSGTKSLYLLPRGLAVPSALVTFPLSVQIPHPANHTPQFLLLLNLKMHVCLA